MIALASDIAFGLLALGGLLTMVRLTRGPSLADRMVALDTLLFIGTAAVGVYVARTGRTAFVPLIIAAVLVAFVGTVVVARAIEAETDR